MESHNQFLAQELINDLLDMDKSLVGPLLKLRYFGRLIKNTTLMEFAKLELEGYAGVDSEDIPAYRKCPGEIRLVFYFNGASRTEVVPATLLEEPRLHESFRYLNFREGISTVETIVQAMKDDSKNNDHAVGMTLQFEILRLFETALRNRNPGDNIKVISGGIEGSKYKFAEVLTIVRSRLVDFVGEIADEFGYKIDISTFNQKNSDNNQKIVTIMNNTEIHNSGDGVVVNTGDHSNLNAKITVNKGDWDKLSSTLRNTGVDERDIEDLKPILQREMPENGNLGPETESWIKKASRKALKGAGTIGEHAVGHLIAAMILGFHGH